MFEKRGEKRRKEEKRGEKRRKEEKRKNLHSKKKKADKDISAILLRY